MTDLPEFIVGMPTCNEPRDLLTETLAAIHQSSRQPSKILIIDNGDVALQSGHDWNDRTPITIARPGTNIGCAAAWNRLHKYAGLKTLIIINADCAVAPDTFERMLEAPAPAVVLAFGFSCFRIDAGIRDIVGDFDEAFYPAYFEDTDYRRRLQLADIEPIEWPRIVSKIVYPGRESVTSGITHGKHDPDGYQGWRAEKLEWFRDRYEANKKLYADKWGGEPGHETFNQPFGGVSR